MSDAVRLRPQREDDVEALVALAQRAWADVEVAVDAVLGAPLDRVVTPSWAAHHEAAIRGVCEDDASTVVVAEDGDGRLLGVVSSRVHPASAGMSSYGQVEILAVDPSARGRGVGRRLLDRAVADLRSVGVPVLMVETGGDDGHAPARRLYEAAGFRALPTVQYWLATDTDG